VRFAAGGTAGAMLYPLSWAHSSKGDGAGAIIMAAEL
jgi:hypothetical protein